MRLALDLQAAQSQAHAERGIARYSIELTQALLRAGAPVDSVLLNPHLAPPRGMPADLAASPLVRWRDAATILEVAARGPSAYVLLSPIELELPPLRTIPESAIQRCDAIVAVVYDLIPLVFAARYLAADHLREAYLARLALLRQADLLLTISEHTRRDVIEHLGVAAERVVTIGGGVSPWFSAGDPADLAGHDRPYVLCVTGWEWRKNTENLIRAFGRLPAAVRRAHQLVLTCAVPPEGEAQWRAEAEAAGMDPGQLVVTGRVDDATLRDLYRGAALFAFPSRYEGFGLPVAEAARCGVPVVTSSTSSLPEILDLPESTFDPEDVEDIARVVERGLTDGAFRGRLLAASARAADVHTWDAVAHRFVTALESLPQPRRARRRPPIRLAFVGPLPPTESGVATYNERVLAELVHEDDLDVHVFVDGGDIDRPPLGAELDVRVLPIEALDRHVDSHDYDTFVHTIGNQRWHVRGFDLARRHPGIVWLHDASLVGLHLEWALWRIRTGQTTDDVVSIFRQELAELYGERVRPEAVLAGPLSHRAFVANQVHLAAGLARGARHLVANSQLALDMVRHDLGPGGRLPPSTVLHHAVPRLSTGFTRRPDPDGLVVALGVVHAVKRPEVLVRAFASLAPQVLARLAFVGPCDGEARAAVMAEAARLGVADRVTITGFVDRDEYERWLSRATVAVQLREPTFGESSGAVHDALASGVPVVTSIASCRDLPAGVVELVAHDVSDVDLSAVIRALLGDPSRFASMGAAQAVFAAEWTFARVAREVAAVVRQVVLAQVPG